MNEMVKRVGEIIAEICNMRDYRGDPERWRIYADDARRIIAAMREPTEVMVSAGKMREIEMPLGNGQTIRVPGLAECGATSYQRMIDAALKE